MISFLREKALSLNGSQKLSLPNKVTLARIFFVPLVVVFLIRPSQWSCFVAGTIFIIASLTDWLDGHLARTRNQVTTLGKMLDPIADKVLVASGLIPLVALGRVPAWMVVILLGREFGVTALRFYTMTERISIPSTWLGKVKTVLQVVAIALLIIYHKALYFHLIGMVVLWLALITSVASGVDYFYSYLNFQPDEQRP